MDPIHQFSLSKWLPIAAAGRDFSLTNSAFYMLVSVAVVSLLTIVCVDRNAVVPGRMQSIAESSYEFIANMVREAAGESGMRFFPLVFSLFMFILICNLIGFIPYTFTVTSHIVVTATLALIVFFTVLIVGFAKNGAHFLKLFVPSGVPIFVLPLVIAIEVISFLSRPLSHSVRLFANMLAGHILLKVFGGFVVLMLGLKGLGALAAALPFAFTVALMALELLVAFLQAYVFAMLTCMYLNDALHPGH
jgi:F-type H+-transporting ATPase subunit a